MEEQKSAELAIVEHFSLLSKIESAATISQKFKFFSQAVSQEPIVKKNMSDELAKKGLNHGKSTDYDYMPVGVIEEMLRQLFFGQVKFETVNCFRDLNSFVTVVRIHYKSPISNEWLFADGIGAKALQQDSGAKIHEFNHTMKANALELGVGISYSRAIKNAAKKLGKAFGAELNRDEELDDIVVYNKGITQSKEDKIKKLSELWELKKEKVQSKDYNQILQVVESKKADKACDRAIKLLEAL